VQGTANERLGINNLLNELLEKLKQSSSAGWFKVPVSRAQCPDYHQVLKEYVFFTFSLNVA
jgi:hypothetical protein